MTKTIWLTGSLVMMLMMLPQENVNAKTDHSLLTKVLSTYVDAGRIDFKFLCQDDSLDQYTDQLNATNPDLISDQMERFAFWLNVYNAYSLKAICSKYPIKSINELNFGGLVLSVVLKKSIWDKPLVLVNQTTYTLKQVDHEILRPQFKDPRIQFAISCGAIGCAASRSDAYEAGMLDRQLDEQTTRFINDARLNQFDMVSKTATLSPLFNWSSKSFGQNQAEVLVFIAKYLPKNLAQSIMDDPLQWTIKYNSYDLTLNDAKK